MRYIIWSIIYWSVIIISIILTIIINKRKLKDSPLDDSNWNINYDALKTELRKFVSNKSEEIVAVLGKANAITLLNNSINSRGFCILSDKAFYFVGNVYQKKYIGSFKTNIQHRVPVTEMKGIKVGTLHRYEMFIFGMISIITFINEVKIFITMLYADYNWFVYIDEDTIPFIMISSLLASAVTLIMSVYYIFQAILVKRTTVCIREFDS